MSVEPSSPLSRRVRRVELDGSFGSHLDGERHRPRTFILPEVREGAVLLRDEANLVGGRALDQAEIDTITAWIAAGAPRLGDECPIDCSGTDPGPQDPVAQINHPGDGEDRAVNVPIPFIGLANDPQDGMIPADKLVWTSDIEGQIGVGDKFDAPLTMVGKHTITLTATDIDGNEGTASIVLNVQ
jgi:hypothetical protein